MISFTDLFIKCDGVSEILTMPGTIPVQPGGR